MFSFSIGTISILYPKGNKLEITTDSTIDHKITLLRDLKYQEQVISKEIDSINFDIKSYMKDCDTLIDSSGSTVATWKSSSPRNYIDLKRLEEEHKDLYMQYLKPSKETRTFLIK